MFRRKEEFENTDNTTDLLSHVDDDVIETEKASVGATSYDSQPSAEPSPYSSFNASPLPKPGAATPFRPAAAAAMASRVPVPAAEARPGAGATATNKGSKRVLTVGHDIHMKGEISTCDRLVIEGSVDATLKDVHTVELAQTGSFKGNAEIEDAEISGVFEGDLTVRGRLIIYSTGRVAGNISYGEIEIERGGQISGTIQTASQRDAKKKAA